MEKNRQIGVPEVTFNKSGFEIRTEVLKMAQQQLNFDYTANMQLFQMSQKTDPESGAIIHTVTMPQVPGVAEVLSAAEQMYKFITMKK